MGGGYFLEFCLEKKAHPPPASHRALWMLCCGLPARLPCPPAAPRPPRAFDSAGPGGAGAGAGGKEEAACLALTLLDVRIILMPCSRPTSRGRGRWGGGALEDEVDSRELFQATDSSSERNTTRSPARGGRRGTD